MKAKERYIETEYGRIWVGIYGEAQPGIPLLVVHGGPGFLSMPREICDLADRRPVIFYDQLGCGRSDRPATTERYTVAHYVDELALVREQLKLERLHIMGQSWGTMLAAEYVLRRRPLGVQSLIFSGPLLSSPLWERDQRAYLADMPAEVLRVVSAAEESGRFGDDYEEAMMEYYRRHVLRLDPWPDDVTEALGKLNADVYLTMWGPSEFTVTGALKGADLMSRLPEIECPVLLICGERDEAAPKTVKTYCDRIPQAEMTVLSNASHLHHLEQPVTFRAVVNDFLSRAVRGSITTEAIS